MVEADSRVKLVPITIERDTGATLHIAAGLTGEERILKIAIPWLTPGTAVEVVARRKAETPSPTSGSRRRAGRRADRSGELNER